MRSLDRGTSLFWFVFSAITCIGSYRIGIGKLHVPGMGFMPFLAAALLGILSLVLFISSSLKKRTGENEQHETASLKGIRKGAVVIIALMIYAWLVSLIGYSTATLLFMGSLFRFAGVDRWWKVILYSLLTTTCSFLIFSKWLMLQFPVGPWGF